MKTKYLARVLSYLKSGTLQVSEEGKPAMQLMVDEKEKIVNILNLSELPAPTKNFFSKLSDTKAFAKKLNEDGITLVIKDKGQAVIKLGKGAKPKFSRIVTSGNVEVVNLSNLKKLDKKLRTK